MELIAYAAFILVLAAPFLVAAGLLALLLAGTSRMLSAIRNKSRIDVLGIAMVAGALTAGTVSYQWLRGPKAELATLQPLVVDRQLAARLPRTWVFEYGGAFIGFDLLTHGYADRVLNSRITAPALLASIPQRQRDAYMEEVTIVDTPACRAFQASGSRSANRILECIKETAVRKADMNGGGPYLTLSPDKRDDVQSITFAMVTAGNTRPIARCLGRAPREANPLLAMVRRNRSMDVASSMYGCKIRAASGGLSRVIATGATL